MSELLRGRIKRFLKDLPLVDMIVKVSCFTIVINWIRVEGVKTDFPVERLPVDWKCDENQPLTTFVWVRSLAHRHTNFLSVNFHFYFHQLAKKGCILTTWKNLLEMFKRQSLWIQHHWQFISIWNFLNIIPINVFFTWWRLLFAYPTRSWHRSSWRAPFSASPATRWTISSRSFRSAQ